MKFNMPALAAGLRLPALVLIAGLALAGCRRGAPPPPTSPTGTRPAAMQLTSSAFHDGGAIPSDYTCDGSGGSPPLEWSGAPPGTASFVLIVHDPDAPAGDFLHWLAVDIPPGTRKMASGATDGRALRNDFRKPGWGAPCPPSGTHHYVFELHALDVPGLAGANDRSAVEKAMRGHVLAMGKLTGTYGRK